MSYDQPRRRFSKKERRAIYLAADGKSDISGKPLGDTFHADHKVPFSKGGPTDVVNGQATTPEENMAKSDRHVEPRGWQRQFVQRWLTHKTKDFLLAAIPGAGKTIASLIVAKMFLDSNEGGRVIVVVPSTNLRDQWRDEAWKNFGISLQTKEFRGTLKTDHQGAVVTYQTAANEPTLFRAIVSRQPTLVIFDEIHHAGDEKSWGEAIKHAFEAADKRLALSGTPFRTDGKQIPFIAYAWREPPDVEFPGMYAAPDMVYDYPEAIRDTEIIRVVSFDHSSGEVRYQKGEEVLTATIDPDVSEAHAKEHLRKLLAADGEWVRSLVRKAHNKLMDLRQYRIDAGGLILCVDSNHALAVAKVLRQETGINPDVVLSDDEKANSSVETFRNSSRQWIVAVRQVSEGVDIKRLMVLCYLTNTVTELFFRQAVGRIVRHQGTEFDNDAYCFIPADTRLIQMAKRILKWQGEALQQEEDEAEREERERSDRTEHEISVLETSEAVTKGLIIEGKEFTVGDAETICRVAQEFKIPQAVVAAMIRRGVIAGQSRPEPVADKEPRTEKSPEVTADELRKRIARKVGMLAKMTDSDYKDVHTWYMKNKCGVPQKDMSIKQLAEKLQWLEKQIQAERAK